MWFLQSAMLTIKDESMSDKALSRLHPFEGLCLTSKDLLDEQTYHRESLQLHNFHLHGYGVVHGLQVEFQSMNSHLLVM